MYNILTYLIPAIYKLRGHAFIRQVLTYIRTRVNSDALLCVEIKLQSMVENSIELAFNDCEKMRCMQFQIIAKKRDRKPYTPDEIQYVLDCVKDFTCKELGTFPYFICNVYIQCTTILKTNGNIDMFLSMINTLHDMAMELLKQEDHERVSKGVLIYSIIYESIYKDKRVKLPSGFSKEIVDCLFLDYLIYKNNWDFGSREDIIDLVANIKEDNAEAILSLFMILDNAADIVTYYNIEYIYQEVIHKPDAYIESTVTKFMEFGMKYYSDNLKTKIITQALACLEKSLTLRTIKIECHLVSCLLVLCRYVKMGGEVQATFNEDIKQLILNILEEFESLENHDEDEIKLAERSLSTAFEINLHMGVPSDDMFQLVELGLVCNMRSTVAQLQIYLTKFIQTSFTSYLTFYNKYYNYALHKLINSARLPSARLRRSLEHRIVLLALCTSADHASKKEFVKNAVQTMTDVSLINDDNICIILYCLDEMMTDSTLKTCTESHLEDVVIFCLYISTKFNTFSVQNAVNYLFNDLVKRIFPSNDNYKNLCLFDFFLWHPRLFSLLKGYHGPTRKCEQESKLLFASLLTRSHNENVIAFPDQTLGLEAIAPDEAFLATQFDVITKSRLRLYADVSPRVKFVEVLNGLKRMITVNISRLTNNNVYFILTAMAGLAVQRNSYLTSQHLRIRYNPSRSFVKCERFMNKHYDLTDLHHMRLIRIIAKNNGLLCFTNDQDV